MPLSPPRPVPPGRRAGSRVPAAILFALALLSGAALTMLNASAGAGATAPASPLLFGENLDLYAGTASTDWFLSQPALRAGLVAAHVQIIRLPVRGSSPSSSGIANWAEVQQALQDVKAMNITPLIILRNPQDPALQADDEQVVNYVSSLFGTRHVYYEWANETDLPGNSGQVSAATYLASWNNNVPQLKTLAGPTAQFIGPVNYQYDASYLQTFLAGANPLPDAISWHSYTCDDATATEATCLANIDHWTTNFAAARTLMTNTIGKQLPIWITEWNYTPSVTSGDSKHTDTAFLKQWTTKALQTLAADGITASMHFNVNNLNVTNGSFPLVDYDGSLAAEGIAFSAQYDALVGTGTSPSPSTSPSVSASSSPSAGPSASASASSSPSASAPPTGSAPKYSFEDGGLDGWSATGNVTSLTDSTAVGGKDGSHALAIEFESTQAGDQPYVHVNPSGGGPAAGQTVTAYLYVPSGTADSISAKLYVQDPNFAWHTATATVVSTRGSWVELAFTPSGYSGNALQLGVQFQETPYSSPATVYLDAVDWA